MPPSGGYFLWWSQGERNRTDINAICPRHIAATSANTGCYLNFLSLVKENANESPAGHIREANPQRVTFAKRIPDGSP